MKLIRYCFCILIIFFSSNCIGQWTQEANYPGAVTDEAVAFAVGDSVYIGAGSSGSTNFYLFDPSSAKWTRKRDISERAAGVSFAIGTKGYVALGQSDPTNTGQASVTNDFWEYEPATDIWSQEPNFPGKPRDAAFAFVIGNKAYVGGGVDTGGYPQPDFYSFDPSVGHWDTLNTLPDFFYFNSTFVVGNNGYLATGVGESGELTSLWQYDTASDSWSQMPDFPGAARESAVAFSLNGIGYVGLGQTQYTSVFTDFYSYDPSADKWSPVTPFPGAHGRGWAVGVATTTTAFVGLGTYFPDSVTLVANNDFWEFSTSSSIAANVSNVGNIELYPNPAIDFVSIDIPNSEITTTVNVRNEIGVLCLTAQLNSDRRLDLSSLPSGIYNIEIASGDYHVSERVVKE